MDKNKAVEILNTTTPVVYDAKREGAVLLLEALAAAGAFTDGEFTDGASEWRDEDRPLPEDAAINAAHPIRTGNHAAYAEATRMVGAKRSKGALVELVNWLLTRNEQPGEAALTEIEKYARAVLDAGIDNVAPWNAYALATACRDAGLAKP